MTNIGGASFAADQSKDLQRWQGPHNTRKRKRSPIEKGKCNGDPKCQELTPEQGVKQSEEEKCKALMKAAEEAFKRSFKPLCNDDLPRENPQQGEQCAGSPTFTAFMEAPFDPLSLQPPAQEESGLGSLIAWQKRLFKKSRSPKPASFFIAQEKNL